MKFIFKLFLLVAIGVVLSCDHEKKTLNKIDGGWIIQEFHVNGMNYFDSLRYNYIRFNKNSPRFPFVTINGMSNFEQEDVLFHISSKNNEQLIKIDSKNPYLNRSFKIDFFDDPEHNFLFLHLVSDSVTLIALKREEYLFGL